MSRRRNPPRGTGSLPAVTAPATAPALVVTEDAVFAMAARMADAPTHGEVPYGSLPDEDIALDDADLVAEARDGGLDPLTLLHILVRNNREYRAMVPDSRSTPASTLRYLREMRFRPMRLARTDGATALPSPVPLSLPAPAAEPESHGDPIPALVGADDDLHVGHHPGDGHAPMPAGDGDEAHEAVPHPDVSPIPVTVPEPVHPLPAMGDRGSVDGHPGHAATHEGDGDGHAATVDHFEAFREDEGIEARDGARGPSDAEAAHDDPHDAAHVAGPHPMGHDEGVITAPEEVAEEEPRPEPAHGDCGREDGASHGEPDAGDAPAMGDADLDDGKDGQGMDPGGVAGPRFVIRDGVPIPEAEAVAGAPPPHGPIMHPRPVAHGDAVDAVRVLSTREEAIVSALDVEGLIAGLVSHGVAPAVVSEGGMPSGATFEDAVAHASHGGGDGVPMDGGEGAVPADGDVADAEMALPAETPMEAVGSGDGPDGEAPPGTVHAEGVGDGDAGGVGAARPARVVRTPKPMWLIQTNLGSQSDVHGIVRAVRLQGLPCQELELVPMDPDLPEVDHDGPVVVYGSNALTVKAHRAGTWTPGVWFDEALFSYPAWAENYGSLLLNDPAECEITTVGEFAATDRPDADMVFMRPLGDLKDFNGEVREVWEARDWCRDVARGGYPTVRGDTRIVVGPPHGIAEEWRLFMVDGHVAAASRYRTRGRLSVEGGAPDEVKAFGVMVASRWSPAPAFVLDVCRSGDGLYVVEAQCINSAGFYEADLGYLVRAMTVRAARDWALAKGVAP